MTILDSPKRVLLIGSTGAMGRAALRMADPRHIAIRAFARNPDALAPDVDDVVQGDVRDEASLQRALVGIDAVLCILGGKPWHRDAKAVHEIGTKNLISAMRSASCQRLVAVTGVGAGSSRGHGPFYYDWFARPTVLRSVYADKERQEQLIRQSSLDWTIVRPAILVARTPARPVRLATTLAPRQKMGSISREDVSQFLLSELIAQDHNRETVHIFT